MGSYLDSIWFAKFATIAHISYVDLLVLDQSERAQQRELFLRGEIENPYFTYPQLRDFNFAQKKTQLENLYNEIEREEKNEWVREAYMRVLREKMQHVAMLEAVAVGDDAAFATISVQEFGDYSPKIAKEILSLVGEVNESVEMDLVNADEIEARFRTAFVDYGITDWNIVRDTDNTNAFVHLNQETKTLFIPQSRRLGRAHLEALVRHEVGVHIMRRKNAEQTSLQLLTLGLDHYIKGDEGLGKYEELKVWSQAFEPSWQNYVGVAMVKGFDGKPRTFRELFEFFGQYLDNDQAWTRVEKIFRGTTGQSRGLCWTKDIMYLNGYYDIVETLQKYPQEESRFLIGKYDPANEWHRTLLDNLL